MASGKKYPRLVSSSQVLLTLVDQGMGRDDALLAEMLRLVELPGYERRKPNQISGGHPDSRRPAEAVPGVRGAAGFGGGGS